MSTARSNHSASGSSRWSIGHQFTVLGIILLFSLGLMAFLARRGPKWISAPEQITVDGPVTFTSSDLPPGCEIKLSPEASAGFARLIGSGSDTFDGRFLEAAMPYGAFHVQGRSFDWHFRAFIADTRNKTRPRVWGSQVLANMFRSLSAIDESKAHSEKSKIDDDWEPDLSGFVMQPSADQITDRENRVRAAWEADLAGFADQP